VLADGFNNVYIRSYTRYMWLC